jgi:hypothetical protein
VGWQFDTLSINILLYTAWSYSLKYISTLKLLNETFILSKQMNPYM